MNRSKLNEEIAREIIKEIQSIKRSNFHEKFYQVRGSIDRLIQRAERARIKLRRLHENSANERKLINIPLGFLCFCARHREIFTEKSTFILSALLDVLSNVSFFLAQVLIDIFLKTVTFHNES